MKKLHARELSRNQSILRFDVILQHNWPIEQWVLHIRVFRWREKELKWPCFHLFIHWLIKQITKTYQNHFSRSYKNSSNLYFSNLPIIRTNFGTFCQGSSKNRDSTVYICYMSHKKLNIKTKMVTTQDSLGFKQFINS